MVTRDDLEVLEANDAFYRAFRAGDVDALDGLWARGLPCACVHPGAPPLTSRDEVMGSWRSILAEGAPDVSYDNAQAFVYGDVAFVICTERVGEYGLNATNVYAREDGRWAMVHHHAAQGAVAETAPAGPVH